jgi:hypothetical protein
MLHTLKATPLLLIAISLLFSGYQKPTVTPDQPQISKELKEQIQADADKRIVAILANKESQPVKRTTTDCGYAYCTNINYQVGGSSSCTLNMTTERNSAVPPFSTLCADPNNFRYGVVYFGSAAQGAIYGPTGGCMAGSLTYTINGSAGYSQQPSYVLVYNVYNGPGGGATFVGHVSGNVVNIQCQ